MKNTIHKKGKSVYWKKLDPKEEEFSWNVNYKSQDKEARNEWLKRNRAKQRRAEYKSHGKNFIINSATNKELDEWEKLMKERRRKNNINENAKTYYHKKKKGS